MRYLDLCCGIGSFHHAFRSLGWTCIGACDIDKHARACYETLYGLVPETDVFDLDPESLPPYDVLCSGFPCQSFSQMGKRAGLDDPRGSVFLQVLKFLRASRPPRIALLENVVGLRTHDRGRTLASLVAQIEACGYRVAHDVWNAADMGIPQARKRLWIVAVRRSEPVRPEAILDVLHLVPARQTLSDLLGVPVVRPAARTIRTGGRTRNMHCPKTWEWYRRVDGDGHVRLSLEDTCALQGFPRTHAQTLPGPKTQIYKRLGNTIPTVFPRLLGLRIRELYETETVRDETHAITRSRSSPASPTVLLRDRETQNTEFPCRIPCPSPVRDT